jgi:Protein of unknown function (DUF2971)
LSRIPDENDPIRNPILYHYCSTDVLISIIQKREIWLSDINTMNDYSETHWAYDRFIEAANLVLDRVGLDFVELVDEIISASQTRILPFIFCLSSDGDVLSQWRSYAADGTGVSLGFDAALLQKLAVRSAQIEYDRNAQNEFFKAWLLAVHEVWSTMPKEKREDFLFQNAAKMGVDLACFKNPAFAEEKEVRLVRAIEVEGSGLNLRLRDNGAAGRTRVAREKLPIQYRTREGGIVMYVKIPLLKLGNELIREVVLGPKSHNQGNEIISLLNQSGFRNFSIRKSSATYR